MVIGVIDSSDSQMNLHCQNHDDSIHIDMADTTAIIILSSMRNARVLMVRQHRIKRRRERDCSYGQQSGYEEKTIHLNQKTRKTIQSSRKDEQIQFDQTCLID
jgi:hypothetical protein